jgi:capsular exopolysaccharide synthesis family protein
LHEYRQLLRRGKWWIAAGLLLGMLGGQLIALASTPIYVATITLYFAGIEGGGEPGQAYQGAMLAEQKARAYAPLMVSDRVLAEVSYDMGSPVARSAITVQSAAGNPTLDVKVSDPSPQRAAKIADALAQRTSNLVGELEAPRDPILSRVLTLRILAPAAVPDSPTSPNPKVDVLVGGLIGTFLGLSVALISRALDRSVRTREALEELTHLPLLGTVPYDRRSRRIPRLVPDQPRGHVAEAVRQLRVNLRSVGMGSGCTSLLVTSAVAEEGKTSLVCNLAAAFGLEGSRVLLIDANLREPSVDSYLEMNTTPGLSAVLLGKCQPHDAVRPWRDGLFDVLTSGPIAENPSELLGSTRTRLMLIKFESQYDVILVDSPALLPVADATTLARVCDGVLLVTRYGRAPAVDVTDALDALHVVSANVLGCAFSMERRPNRTVGSRANRAPAHELNGRTAHSSDQTESHPVRKPPADSESIPEHSASDRIVMSDE